MTKFKIQTYNREMTRLIDEVEEEFDKIGEALLRAYSISDLDKVIVLMRKSTFDDRFWKIVAKFY